MIPLFLVSAAVVAFEVQLTRYFAVASWSEYGYWVISITMTGFAVSGVLISLFESFFKKRGPGLRLVLIPAMMAAGVLGMAVLARLPFNLLLLQNKDLWSKPFLQVAAADAVLFPFCFLAGLFIGISFLLMRSQIGSAYAADLLGASTGTFLVLGAMYFMHPFRLQVLVPALLFAAYLFSPRARQGAAGKTALVLALFLACEVVIFRDKAADYCEYKPIYPALRGEGLVSREAFTMPRGLYELLDSPQEREDIDLSNNAGGLGIEGPPRSTGLYLDGERIAGIISKRWGARLPPGPYSASSLDALPYKLRPGAKTLLLGTNGGFRLEELSSPGPSQLTGVESDPLLHQLLKPRSGTPVFCAAPLAFLRLHPGPYDVVEVSPVLVEHGPGGQDLLTQEGLRLLLASISKGGILSLPISIRETSVYADKLLLSVRRALESQGESAPGQRILLYRSAWNARILVFGGQAQAKELALAREFCDKLSFDLSYYPGAPVREPEVWNALPPSAPDELAPSPAASHHLVGMEGSAAGEEQDSLRRDSLALLGPDWNAFIEKRFFDLRPSSQDRPGFSSILRWNNLRTFPDLLEWIPRDELGFLVNLAVLAQSLVLALLVVMIPALFGPRSRGQNVQGRTLIYFPCLGLGFLFVEIYLIGKGSFLLGDRTTAFALVLGILLAFSGLGSWLSGRPGLGPRRKLLLAVLACTILLALSAWLLDPLLLRALAWSFPAKALLLIGLTAALALPLGFPFALGLGSLAGRKGELPWAWALNGAFSVMASPLAQLLTQGPGMRVLACLAIVSYMSALAAFPGPFSDSHSS